MPKRKALAKNLSAHVEIGSYGIREHEGHRWVYGTGLAEPRFSALLQRIRNESDGPL